MRSSCSPAMIHCSDKHKSSFKSPPFITKLVCCAVRERVYGTASIVFCQVVRSCVPHPHRNMISQAQQLSWALFLDIRIDTVSSPDRTRRRNTVYALFWKKKDAHMRTNQKLKTKQSKTKNYNAKTTWTREARMCGGWHNNLFRQPPPPPLRGVQGIAWLARIAFCAALSGVMANLAIVYGPAVWERTLDLSRVNSSIASVSKVWPKNLFGDSWFALEVSWSDLGNLPAKLAMHLGFGWDEKATDCLCPCRNKRKTEQRLVLACSSFCGTTLGLRGFWHCQRPVLRAQSWKFPGGCAAEEAFCCVPLIWTRDQVLWDSTIIKEQVDTQISSARGHGREKPLTKLYLLFEGSDVLLSETGPGSYFRCHQMNSSCKFEMRLVRLFRRPAHVMSDPGRFIWSSTHTIDCIGKDFDTNGLIGRLVYGEIQWFPSCRT